MNNDRGNMSVVDIAKENWRIEVLEALESDPVANHFVFRVLRSEFENAPEGGLWGAIRTTFTECETVPDAVHWVQAVYRKMNPDV